MMLCSTSGLMLSTAHAATVETLLMPGKVSQPHAKYEEDCSLCHDRTDRSRQTSLCLDCHKETASDIVKQVGLHGRMKNIGATQCKACHSEHLGRAADIVKFDRATFDHTGTDFNLEGAHRGLTCVSCHNPNKKLRDAPRTCAACHKDDDLHRGQLKDDCGSCHNSATWSGAKFDHAETDFALQGAHREVRCNACHVGGKYDGTPTRCVACHMPDDVHRGSRGENCAECHTQTDWKTSKFDHAKETGFALLGRHNSLECGSCHTSGRFEDKIENTCVGCHRADDSHAGRFGDKCNDCHGNDRWSGLEYDHFVKAKYTLLGAHAKLDCHACHTADVAKQKLGTDCRSCHTADDPHGGQLKGACDNCHSNEAWRKDIRFDHDLTDFPLLGMHVLVSCAQCHASKAFKGAPTQCVDCHKQNDVHKGGLGRDCADCHSSNSWTSWEFDHQKQTGFALTGAHGKAKCVDCHRQPAAEVKLAKDCAACHRRDDIHLGQFGMQCQRCHSTITFKGARIQ